VAPCAEAALAQAAQVAALHAQVDRLVDLLLYYRHLAAGQTEADLLPATHGPGLGTPVRRRLRPVRSQWPCPRFVDTGYAASCESAIWSEYCSSKSTGVI
jgi:hypothetical protein